MSVYDYPVYRDDPFQGLARQIGFKKQTLPILVKLLNFEIEPHGEFELPANLTQGNLQQQLADRMRDMIELYVGPKPANNVSVVNLLTQNIEKEFVFGLQGVYQLYSKLWQRNQNKLFLKKRDEDFVDVLFRIGAVLGQHTPGDVLIEEKMMSEGWNKVAEPFIVQQRALIKIANAATMKSWKQLIKDANLANSVLKPIDLPEKKLFRGFDIYPLQGLLIMVEEKKVTFLTKKDVDRLDKMLRSTANGNFYLGHYSRMSTNWRNQLHVAHQEYMKLLVETMKDISYAHSQLLCRACDVAYYLKLAQYASDINEDALNDQLNKVTKEKLDEILPVVRMANITKDLPMREALEVLLLYKMLPQADFDYFGAAFRQQELYRTQNKITNEKMFDLMLKHHKLLMIRAFHSRHKVCPGVYRGEEMTEHWQMNYPFINPAQIPVEHVHNIDMNGAFIYKDHFLDTFDLIKDKAICPLEIRNIRDERDLMKLSRDKKNQLLDAITRSEPISTMQLRNQIDNLMWDVKCEDKPEAKKPNGRWFMEAHTDVRMLLSEYEGSVADYGAQLEGFMQGKGLREKQKMMNHVTETIAETGLGTQIFVSLDIAKWSPRMPTRVHTALDEQWADAFGMPHIKELHKVFTEGDMHYVKHSIHHTFKKMGVDFEGFAGRKLTFFHLALEHAVVDQLKKAGLVRGHARYAAQIDDGVVRLYVSEKDVPGQVQEIRKMMYDLWLSCGAEISWDKTFISKEFAVFLNDIRYANRAINPGIRAFIKITNFADAPIASVAADLNMVSSTVRGALVAGATTLVAYYAYCYYIHDTIKKWAHRKFKFEERHVVWFFAPVGLGGAGCENMLTLMGSLDFDAFQTGVGNIWLMTKLVRNMNTYIQQILNQEMAPITEHNKAFAPLSVRRDAPVFRSDRLMIALRRNLAYWLKSPVLQAYDLSGGLEIANIHAVTIGNTVNFPVELRELWADSSIATMLDAIVTKVLKSRTALSLLSRRTLYRISVANIHEARHIISNW